MYSVFNTKQFNSLLPSSSTRYPGALHRWNLRGRPSPWQQTVWEPHLSRICCKCERWLNSLGLCGLGKGRTVALPLYSSLSRCKTDYVRIEPSWTASQPSQDSHNWCCLQHLPLVPSLYIESRDPLLSLWRKSFLCSYTAYLENRPHYHS